MEQHGNGNIRTNLLLNDFLKYNEHMIKNKTVLDLACHDGVSTGNIKNLGSKYIYGVEARKELIDTAKNNVQENVEFFVGDIQDDSLISPLVKKSDTVIVLGVLYHLYNHFGFFSLILKPNIEHVLIETIAGPETLNPEMFWGFEKVDSSKMGWHDTANVIPNGTPNLSWILQAAKAFGFDCDWVKYYGFLRPKTRYTVTLSEYTSIKDESWPDYADFLTRDRLPDNILNDISTLLGDNTDSGSSKRVLIRLYNKNLVKSTPIDIEKHYVWDPSVDKQGDL